MALLYNCCFWFSLRLGGIIIGAFSIVQAVILLFFCCVGYVHPQKIKESTAVWLNSINLIYLKDFVKRLQTDPEQYLGVLVILTCIYIVICLFYVYGAYKYNNILMMVYILVELIRLILLSIFVTTLLLILKQNTMDIGLLIGASVVGGFVLLGMFYLWVCAANLPVVISENEYDEQVATIVKLQQLLKAKEANKLVGFDDTYWTGNNIGKETYRNHLFLASRNKIQTSNDVPHYQSSFYH